MENINDNLERIADILSKTDIFMDKILPIMGSILTPLLATIFGGVITIYLFNKQENIRIKQNLKLKFYDDYKSKYQLLYSDVIHLIDRIKLTRHFEEIIYNTKVTDIESSIDITNEWKTQLEALSGNLSAASNRSRDIIVDLNDLNQFIFSNRRIYGDKESPYNDLKTEFQKISDKFNKVMVAICDVSNSIDRKDILELIRIKLDNDDTNNKDNEDTNNKFEENIEKLKVLIEDIFKMTSDLEELKNKLDNIDKTIEKRFISSYFKEHDKIFI